MNQDLVVPIHDQMGPESEPHVTVGKSGEVTRLSLWGAGSEEQEEETGDPIKPLANGFPKIEGPVRPHLLKAIAPPITPDWGTSLYLVAF